MDLIIGFICVAILAVVWETHNKIIRILNKMEHKTYKYRDERINVWLQLVEKHGFDRVMSHSDLIIKILDKKYPRN